MHPGVEVDGVQSPFGFQPVLFPQLIKGPSQSGIGLGDIGIRLIEEGAGVGPHRFIAGAANNHSPFTEGGLFLLSSLFDDNLGAAIHLGRCGRCARLCHWVWSSRGKAPVFRPRGPGPQTRKTGGGFSVPLLAGNGTTRTNDTSGHAAQTLRSNRIRQGFDYTPRDFFPRALPPFFASFFKGGNSQAWT